jgi:predicted transcriptional regulator of viral defense system
MGEPELFRSAGERRGYFTTAEAEDHGLSRRALVHRAQRGELEHAGYGLWRLAAWPARPDDELYAIQARAPFATFSHDTALSILGLGDLIPSSIHLTIPESSRLGPRAGLRLHRSRSAAMTDRRLRDGLWVSTAVRALLDTAGAGGDPDQMRSAAREARGRSLLSSADLVRLRAHPLFADL